MAGLIDRDYLQDRTPNLVSLSHWDDPGGVIESAASSSAIYGAARTITSKCG
jgi:hypothetical protein